MSEAETGWPAAEPDQDEPDGVGSVTWTFLDDDGLRDSDAILGASLAAVHEAGGVGVVLPGESIGRMPDALTDEQDQMFGDIALRALSRTDL